MTKLIMASYYSDYSASLNAKESYNYFSNYDITFDFKRVSKLKDLVKLNPNVF